VITPSSAKKIIEQELRTRSLPFTKLTAKTVHFTDLAHASRNLCEDPRWHPNPVWSELNRLVAAQGFP